jgi:simple sugar transport system ATP-binding protein
MSVSAAEPTERPPAIELRNISKRFGSVMANRHVNLRIRAGTIHGIVGENGAGKSTLMSIVYGFYEADEGEILIHGRPTTIRSSADAIRAGIGMVHQHFMLVENFTALENIMLGAESDWRLSNSIRHARKELKRLEAAFGLTVESDVPVESLPVGQQQRVEILKALYRGAQILILDEPTGVLTPQETDQLFEILRALKAQGVTVIIITHKLREIMELTDTVSVMRAGEIVANRVTARTSREELAELMVGRAVRMQVEKPPSRPGEPRIIVRDLTWRDPQGVVRVDRVSLEVRAGEILGIAGVSGNGQSELLEILAGMLPIDSGTWTINDLTVRPDHPTDPATVRRYGIAHVPEDRIKRGLIRTFSASESAILGYHNAPEFNGKIVMLSEAIRTHTLNLMHAFDVRPPDPSLKSANFSGGNQQKLILAREMERRPQVLLVGQPTRGVDIGAIEFIHSRILAMREQGSAIILVSGELDEILSLSDRIAVMFEGRIVGTLDASEADERTLGLMMTNAHDHPTGVAS